MNPLRLAALFVLLLSSSFAPASAQIADKDIPPPLQPWQNWVLWQHDGSSPSFYTQAEPRVPIWPSALNFEADAAGAKFTLTVTVYHADWMPLPGSREDWPQGVKINNVAVPVVEHDFSANGGEAKQQAQSDARTPGAPAIRLPDRGTFTITGAFRWDEMPARIVLPKEIGILTLTRDGQHIDAPTWDSSGFLWLKRAKAEAATDKDYLDAQVYRLIGDGIPMWLWTRVELTVAGKSREEDLAAILPEGWQLSNVTSPLPTAIDDQGRMKVQVRAGKWVVDLTAFRTTPIVEFKFPAGAKPTTSDELVAFQAAPNLRMVGIEGIPSVDVSQTTFPAEWRAYPVYRWETANPFKLVERMRGMGERKPESLAITRQLWLSESGRDIIFRDNITGQQQEIWRLDAAATDDLGSARMDGVGQLVTLNSTTKAPGVEIRTRNINLEATGKIRAVSDFSATGWRADADSLTATLNLPPGWRLFALFGADWVKGDWLTAWSLLDIFLLVVFTLAVYRTFGVRAALLACCAFGLAYHEPYSPRYVWIALLVPVALLRVVPEGNAMARKGLAVLKYVTALVLVLILVPFVVREIQQALYPQMESTRIDHEDFFSSETHVFSTVNSKLDVPAPSYPAGDPINQEQAISAAGVTTRTNAKFQNRRFSNANLSQDMKARIQTGPGVPESTWRTIQFGWNGPVQQAQLVQPILIPPFLHRSLNVIRVVLLLALAALILGRRKMLSGRPPTMGLKVWPVTLLAILALTFPASAQLPDAATLDALRSRLLEPSDAFPHAAAIPNVNLTLRARKIVMDAEIHAAARVAVPLPGRLPAWSPLTVLVDGKPQAALRREAGFVWVALEPGVHQVHIEGLVADVTEWEWTFALKPNRVTIDAPGWTWSGVHEGAPEQQVFFALKQKSAAGEAGYDRQELRPIIVVERHLELGLIWQVHTVVQRVSQEGRAVSIRVPLLPGEKVLSATPVPRDGQVDVRLGEKQQSVEWDSEMTPADLLPLRTKADDAWVEHWFLVASPVWNVTLTGLAPVFETGSPELVPVWNPWPGESAEIHVTRPEAVKGATITVTGATQTVSLGDRQRLVDLTLQVQCSVGEDFSINLPADAAVTSLEHFGSIPVRKEGDNVIVSLRPGSQTIQMKWKRNEPLGFSTSADRVTLLDETKQIVESANITTQLNVPSDRWILWTAGPVRGPAVQFWVILICALIAAAILARLPLSPLTFGSWALLGIGLTQTPLVCALIVVGALFLLAWRGGDAFQKLDGASWFLVQFFIVGLGLFSAAVILGVVWDGLLGFPNMYIAGNGSYGTTLNWYQARSEGSLPTPGFISISLWFYRILMLGWALWLAASLMKGLTWAWTQFSRGGLTRPAPTPPPLKPPLA